MKPIYNKTAIENMVELIKDSHPELELSPDKITLSTPTPDSSTSKTTAVDLGGVPKSGFIGTKKLLYNRLRLSTYLEAGQFLVVGTPPNKDALHNTISSQLGIVKTELTLTVPTLPNATTNKIVLAIASVNIGLIYEQAESFTIYLSSVDLDTLYSVTVIIPDIEQAITGDTITVVIDGEEVVFTKDDEGIWNSSDGDYVLTTDGDRVTIVSGNDFTITSGESNLANRDDPKVRPITKIIAGKRVTKLGRGRGTSSGTTRATIVTL